MARGLYAAVGMAAAATLIAVAAWAAQPKPDGSTAPPPAGVECPCGSGKVCVGPRGGRYCITKSGNKEYGK